MGQRKEQQLPIAGGINAGPDEEGLDNYGADTRDCYIDRNNALVRRDGLTQFCDLGTGVKVDGLFWADEWEEMIAISNGNLYRLTDSVGSFSSATGDTLTAGVRPTFAFDNDSLLWIANGGQIVKLQDTGNSAYLADGDAPTSVTHVAFLDNYLLAGDAGTDDFYYSDAGDSTAWSNLWYSAEEQPGPITFMGVANGEILLMSAVDGEVWINDGENPFSRQDISSISQGVIAPYSVIHVDGVWYALNQYREIVALRARNPIPIHPGINEVIQGFTTVNDCLADSFKIHGKTFVMFSFPSEERALVLDTANGLFYEWSYWNSGSAVYQRFKGNCVAFSPKWNKVLVGDRASGKIWQLNASTFTDNGDTIRALRKTGHISYGTMKQKICHGIRVRVKVKTPTPSTPPNLLVDFQDNGSGTFGNSYEIPMYRASNTEFIGYLPGPLGQYTTRQWRFYTTAGDVSFLLAQATEDVELTEF